MQKSRFILLAVLLATTLAIPFRTYAEEKSEETLLKEAVVLAQEIKRFEPMIGIHPSKALSKSTADTKAHSLITLFIQKHGTIATDTPMDIIIDLLFPLSIKEMPIKYVWAYNKNYSTYYRQLEQFASDKAVITPQFAKEEIVRKTEVIFHEDLHANIDTKLDNEALVSPLAYLAVLTFFEYKNDQQNLQTAKQKIQELRTISRELNALVKKLKAMFKTPVYQKNGLQETLNLLNSFPAYYKMYGAHTKEQDGAVVPEAKISHDFMYIKYFDRVITLYEKASKNATELYPRMEILKNLMEEMKRAPKDHKALEKYLNSLEKKYKSPTAK